MKHSKTIIVAAIIVLVLCFGGFAVINRLYTPAQVMNFPIVPTFAYFTSTSSIPSAGISPPVTSTPSAQPFFILPWFSAASPTAVPSNTPIPYKSPTSFSPPISFSPTPTATITLIPQSTSSVLNCRNILYPVKPGHEWNYEVTARGRSGNVRMTIISVEGSQGVVAVENQSRGLSGRAYVACDRDVILNFPTLNAELLFGNALNGTMKADYVSGVLAPNETAFVGSNWALAWSGRYLVSGSGAVTYRGRDINLVLNPSDITMTCQTLASGESAFETVSVLAGTIRALKVVCVGQGQATGTANGTAITGWVSAQSTQWFAPYIGLVKMQSDYANIDIFGITIPLNTKGLSGRIELRNFVQGP